MLFYVSPASVASRVCRDEVQLALTHHKPLVAIHLESTELPSGLELALGRTQAIFRYALKTTDDYPAPAEADDGAGRNNRI
jgi:hypothetical protein